MIHNVYYALLSDWLSVGFGVVVGLFCSVVGCILVVVAVVVLLVVCVDVLMCCLCCVAGFELHEADAG